MNEKLKQQLKKKGLSVYGLKNHLNLKSPQAAQYIVNSKDLTADYNRIKSIAEYCDCSIEEILD